MYHFICKVHKDLCMRKSSLSAQVLCGDLQVFFAEFSLSDCQGSLWNCDVGTRSGLWGSVRLENFLEHMFTVRKKRCSKTFAESAASSILSFHEPIFNDEPAARNHHRELCHQGRKVVCPGIQCQLVCFCENLSIADHLSWFSFENKRLNSNSFFFFFWNWFPCLLEN